MLERYINVRGFLLSCVSELWWFNLWEVLSMYVIGAGLLLVYWPWVGLMKEAGCTFGYFGQLSRWHTAKSPEGCCLHYRGRHNVKFNSRKQRIKAHFPNKMIISEFKEFKLDLTSHWTAITVRCFWIHGWIILWHAFWDLIKSDGCIVRGTRTLLAAEYLWITDDHLC
jgi:hypothetical protein